MELKADKKLRKYTEKIKADVLKNEDTKAFIYVSINNNVIDINQAGTHKKNDRFVLQYAFAKS